MKKKTVVLSKTVAMGMFLALCTPLYSMWYQPSANELETDSVAALNAQILNLTNVCTALNEIVQNLPLVDQNKSLPPRIATDFELVKRSIEQANIELTPVLQHLSNMFTILELNQTMLTNIVNNLKQTQTAPERTEELKDLAQTLKEFDTIHMATITQKILPDITQSRNPHLADAKRTLRQRVDELQRTIRILADTIQIKLKAIALLVDIHKNKKPDTFNENVEQLKEAYRKDILHKLWVAEENKDKNKYEVIQTITRTALAELDKTIMLNPTAVNDAYKKALYFYVANQQLILWNRWYIQTLNTTQKSAQYDTLVQSYIQAKDDLQQIIATNLYDTPQQNIIILYAKQQKLGEYANQGK